MPQRARRPTAAILAGFLVAACSWSRFDELEDRSPVVVLDTPSTVKTGFGAVMTALATPERIQLFVGGSPNQASGVIYELGDNANPPSDSADRGLCGGPEPCWLAHQPAGLGQAIAGSSPQELCFALGFGTVVGNSGIYVRCAGGMQYVLGVPPALETIASTGSAGGSVTTRLVLSSDARLAPSLVAGLSATASAWMYAPLSGTAIELLTTASVGSTYGAAVSALALDNDRTLLFVGEPGARTVHVFEHTGSAGVAELGCITGNSGFGRSLTAAHGHLAISDDAAVHVFDASELASEAAVGCADAAQIGSRQGSFVCQPGGALDECDASAFGDTLQLADLSGDSVAELVVGAPDATVNGAVRAGALLVYDVASGSLLEVRTLASGEKNDRLGASLAAPRLGTRQVLAAGIPGDAKAALFYCSVSVPESDRSPRCRP